MNKYTLITSIFILSGIIIVATLYFLPSTKEKLTKHSWCVDKIYYKGKELTPNSFGLKIVDDNCPEAMRFRENGVVTFPGINSHGYWCTWEFKNDSLVISEDKNIQDTIVEKSIFCGAYLLKINDTAIEIRSDNLVVIGSKYKSNIEIPF